MHMAESMDNYETMRNTFMSNVSHDLRTPLTAICGYLDLLEREEKSENTARYLSLIENRVDAMKQLTEELFRRFTVFDLGKSCVWL